MLDVLAERLAKRPRADVGVFPTPLQHMHRLSDFFGRAVYFKREDLAGLGLGGNKIRMLRFSAGDAIARGADVFVAGGFTQTNHPVQVAAVGSALGIATEVVLDIATGREAIGNLLLHRLMNVRVHYVNMGKLPLVIAECYELARRLARSGLHPQLLTFTPEVRVLCALAFVDGFIELKHQLDAIGVAAGDIFVGSGGPTYAGLFLGACANGGGGLRVHGIPAPGLRRNARQFVMKICSEAAKTIGCGHLIDESHLSLMGERSGIYERLYDDSVYALRAVAQLEGVILDPFYTASAMAEMMRWLAANPATSPMVFVHTGGVAALFAHEKALAATRLASENPTLLLSRVIGRRAIRQNGKFRAPGG